MDKTRLYAYIQFSGNDDFPLEILTNRLGIQPTETWKAGELRNPKYPNHPIQLYTAWIYKIEGKETVDTKDVLLPLLNAFKSKTKIINQLKEELVLDVKLELVIEIFNGHTPAFVIYPEFSRFAGEIDAFLDVDMYVFSFNEPED